MALINGLFICIKSGNENDFRSKIQRIFFENISHLAIHNTFETVLIKFTHRWRLRTKKYFSFCC